MLWPIDLSLAERFPEHAIGAYRSRGMASTRPALQQMEKLSEKIVAVDVRLPSFDNTGKEKASERSHYIMQFEAGEPRIRVALTRAD